MYTGSSSVDIRLSMHQSDPTQPNLVALFTFVARDPSTGKATRVNPVVPQTEQEKQWYAERKELAAARKAARKAAAEAGAAEVPAQAGGCRKRAQALLQEAEVMRIMPGVPLLRATAVACPGSAGGRGNGCTPVH